jgi:hypothetical protein
VHLSATNGALERWVGKQHAATRKHTQPYKHAPRHAAPEYGNTRDAGGAIYSIYIYIYIHEILQVARGKMWRFETQRLLLDYWFTRLYYCFTPGLLAFTTAILPAGGAWKDGGGSRRSENRGIQSTELA